MAHIIVQTATRNGDDVTVTGTVDGVPATVHVWWSHLSTLANKAAMVAYVAPLLKAAVQPQSAQVDLAATLDV